METKPNAYSYAGLIDPIKGRAGKPRLDLLVLFSHFYVRQAGQPIIVCVTAELHIRNTPCSNKLGIFRKVGEVKCSRNKADYLRSM